MLKPGLELRGEARRVAALPGAVLADAGGFGVNDSDLQWSTTLSFDYSFDGAGSLKLGVRYYSIDFSTNRPGGEFAYDASQVGPFIGYSYRF